MKVIDADKLWLDIMMLPHNGDMISSAEVEDALKEADSFDPEKSPWILVAERLPELQENRGKVMVNACNKGNKRSRAMFFLKGRW